MEAQIESNQGKCERGGTLVEYSLLTALVALVAISSVRALGIAVTNSFDDSINCMQGFCDGGSGSGGGEDGSGMSGPP